MLITSSLSLTLLLPSCFSLPALHCLFHVSPLCPQRGSLTASPPVLQLPSQVAAQGVGDGWNVPMPHPGALLACGALSSLQTTCNQEPALLIYTQIYSPVNIPFLQSWELTGGTRN